MTIEVFIIESDEVKVNKTIVVSHRKVPEVNLQEMVDEAYKILEEEMRVEAQRLSEHND